MAPSLPRQRRFSWFTLLGFYLLLLCLTWFLDWGKFTVNVDQLIHDSWVRLSQRTAPDDVVIVGIDPESLDQVGRWPWSRDLQATLFNRLAKSDIRGAALDLIYVEPDDFAGNDEILANSLAQLPNLVLPVLTEGRGVYSEYVEKLPIPDLIQHATNLGHIFEPLDSDGIVRRVNLKSGFNTAHWSAFGLAVSEALGITSSDDLLPGRRLTQSGVINLWIEDYQVLIPFYGPGGTFHTISALDVITNRIEPGFLQNKIVFVGMTAAGLGDVLPTAVSATDKPMSGVEIHANIFAALRDGLLVTQVDSRINYLVAAVVLLLILLLYSRLAPLWGLLSMGCLAIAPVAVSFVMYRFFQLWYPPLVVSIPVLISYFFWSWHRLEFIASFLRHETGKLLNDLVPAEGRSHERLQEFFVNAYRHLPLDGWRFTVQGKEFAGGEVLEKVQPDLGVGRWQQHGSTHSKRYKTTGNLAISFRAVDERFSRELRAYIDSLSRVQEQQRPGALAGTIGRVQGHTYEFSQQLDRLRQLKVLGESIFARSPAGLVVWSASGEVVRSNSLASAMLPDLNVAELPLHDFIRAIGREPDSRDRQTVDELILERIAWQINRLDQETELVINFSAFGNTLAERLISASIVDVTDIRKSERSRAELIDFLSHDLRSPLISSLYLLSGNDSDTDAATEGVEGDGQQSRPNSDRIEHNINLSLEMIDDLLAIARADNLKSDAFIPMLFDSILGNALDILSPQARRKHMVLDEVAEDESLWLECDPSLLERALVNVIGNSIKYSPENTTVRIETTRVDDRLIFRVTDQGVGIAEEMMGSLFQRFKRDKNVAQHYKGSGLGLALVARVVAEHGGSVHATSPGKGTIIEISLPLSLG